MNNIRIKKLGLNLHHQHKIQKDMKKLFTLVLVLIIQSTFAQFNGVANYQSKMSLGLENLEIKGDPALAELLKAKMANGIDESFVLQFNTSETLYTSEQKLENNPNSPGVFMKTSNNDKKLYTNVKEKLFLEEQTTFSEKTYLVKDSLPTYKWEISGESKKIGNYTCFKATSVEKVTAEELAKYEKSVSENKNSTNIMMREKPKDKVVTAWFTNEIPVSVGPDMFWGLPGLILEVQFDKVILVCTKVVLNPTNAKPIERLKKGKLISEKEFEKIQDKEIEKMSEMQMGNSGGKAGTVITIQR